MVIDVEMEDSSLNIFDIIRTIKRVFQNLKLRFYRVYKREILKWKFIFSNKCNNYKLKKNLQFNKPERFDSLSMMHSLIFGMKYYITIYINI